MDAQDEEDDTLSPENRKPRARTVAYHGVAATLAKQTFVGIPKLKVRWARCIVERSPPPNES